MNTASGARGTRVGPVQVGIAVVALAVLLVPLPCHALCGDGDSPPFAIGPFVVLCGDGDSPPFAISTLIEPPTLIEVLDLFTGAHLRVRWSSGPDLVDSFKIYRGEVSGGPYALVGSVGPSSTTYDDSTVEEGKSYYYVVRAERWSHISGDSNEVSGVARYPVVFVNGIFSSWMIWNWMAEQLRSVMAYPATSMWVCSNIDPTGSFRDNAVRLKAYIDDRMGSVQEHIGYRPAMVNIIAHSMGGLIARDYMHGLDPPNAHLVDKVIMLATPNKGVRLANLAKMISPTGWGQWTPWAPDQTAWGDLTTWNVDDMTAEWGDAHTGCDASSPEYYLVAGKLLRTFRRTDGLVRAGSVFGIDACGKYSAMGAGHFSIHDSESVLADYIIPVLSGNPPPDRGGASSDESAVDEAAVLAVAGDSLEAGRFSESAVWVDAGVDTVSFTSLWFGGDLFLTCRSPSGVLVDSLYAHQDPSMNFIRGEGDSGGSETFTIQDPEPGEWHLRVECHEESGWVMVCTLGASLVTLLPSVPEDPVVAGTTVTIALSLTEADAPLSGASCMAWLRAPSAAVDSLALYDDGQHEDGAAGDGGYANSYSVGGGDGVYTVGFEAAGEAPVSGQFRRLESRAFTAGDHTPPTVRVLSPNGGEELIGGAQCTLRWLAEDTGVVDYSEVILSYDNGSTYPDTLARFSDPDPPPDSTYVWTVPDDYQTRCRLAVLARDCSGNWGSDISDATWSVVPSTGVPADEPLALSGLPRLFQNVPNPFNPVTTIAFETPAAARSATLTIHNLRGAAVREWSWASPAPGVHHVNWDSTDGRGRRVGSGVYFYRLQIDEWSDLKKMVILK